MKLFISPITSDRVLLSESESQHLVKVLRIKVGEKVFVTDGNGNMIQGVVMENHPKKSLVQVQKRWGHYQKRDYTLHIAIAPTKSISRLEFFLEKVVEFGVDQISFLQTFHSERKNLNINRCQKIVNAAVKQSLSAYVPKLNDLISFENFLETHQSEKNIFLAHCNSNFQTQSFAKVPIKNQKIVVMIGPEGDFSENEIQYAKKHQAQWISLGEKRLRTESAAIYVSSIMSWIHEV